MHDARWRFACGDDGRDSVIERTVALPGEKPQRFCLGALTDAKLDPFDEPKGLTARLVLKTLSDNTAAVFQSEPSKATASFTVFGLA